MTELSPYAYEIVKSRYFWDNEDTWEQLCYRVSSEVAKNEYTNQDIHQKEFMEMMESMVFIPAGRILRNIGKQRPSTSNCNVIPIEDNIESIFESLKYYGIISAHGGGTGLNFSTLRPKGAEMKTKGGNSSGMLSFLKMFNYCGQFVETGGQRRSAGIALCRISHPEVLDFIDAKIKHDELNMFNISVIIDDTFLKAVERDDNWDLKFAGKVYNTVKAKDIWYKILDNMLNHAEPGLIYWNKLRKNNSYYFAPISCVNPCGELPLDDFNVCNLGSIVLPKFVTKGGNTKWQELKQTIRSSVRFLDNIIDIAFYPIQQQEPVVKNARRIGLGTMGLADYLFLKQIRYGSERAIQEIDRLYKFIRDEAYIMSVDLAKEKGAFPKYDRVDYLASSFIRKLPASIRLYIKENTIRNVTLLTAAPTGSTAMIPGVVGGIEPLPFKGYRRVDGVGERIYVHNLCYENCVEDWFVDSYDLKPEEHLETQVAIQKYIDGGVSKTIILPEKTSIDDLDDVLREYVYDLKGVTVYRNNSREEQVYYRLSTKEIQKYIKEGKVENESEVSDCKSGSCDI